MLLALKMTTAISIACLSMVQFAFASCPYEIGQYVNAEPAESVYAQLQPFELVQGEYETTADFKSRSEAVGARKPPILVAGSWKPIAGYHNYVDYEPDQGRFIVNKYVFDPAGSLSALNMPASVKSKNLKFYELKDISVELSSERGSVLATNYWLLEEFVADSSFLFEWVPDIRRYESRVNSLGKADVQSIKVEPQIAKSIAETFQVGFHVTPKAPYILEDARSRNKEKIIVADIHCAVITDGSGKVFKTILANRPKKSIKPPESKQKPKPKPVVEVKPAPESEKVTEPSCVPRAGKKRCTAGGF